MLNLSIEDLEKRIANIAQQIEQMIHNIQVLNGSKLTMEGLLAEAKKAVEEAQAPVSATESAVVEGVVE